MDMYKLKFTKLQLEIFRLLCVKAGERLNQRQIARLLKVSPTAIAKAIPKLEKESLLIKEKQKNMNLILLMLNRNNKMAMQLKRVENLKLIYEARLNEFLEEGLPGATIILFGSYSRGDDTLSSDIDIAIIGRKEKGISLENFEKRLERKIILNFYPSLKEVHKELKENICNGIVLSGGVEL
ncbi:nucleotidyltransferase domain-containing protein [Candidatus Woesearchaeota archaeon]|nr:nucleotidyltransferase domain-containing protein [Candidatus Woesearchaeota archaeon]